MHKKRNRHQPCQLQHAASSQEVYALRLESFQPWEYFHVGLPSYDAATQQAAI